MKRLSYLYRLNISINSIPLKCGIRHPGNITEQGAGLHPGWEMNHHRRRVIRRIGLFWKKQELLSSIFAVQMSMNFNSSVYPSVVTPLSKHLGASEQAARVGQYVLLALYAIGCERWAPWSKEFSLWPILQYVDPNMPEPTEASYD